MKKVVIIIVCVVVSLIAIFLKTSRPDDVTNTTRYSLEYYKSLQLDTPFLAITEKIGRQDSEIGSGIHIFVYRLPDGSEILLGYADLEKLMYVKQKKTDGTIINLVYK